MDLNALAVFARVVEAGSFVRASDALDMPRSTVSRKVAELEDDLGARLLQRTTRKLSLTDAGRALLVHATRVVAEAEAAEQAVARMEDAPRGLLRVTIPLNFGFLDELVAGFLVRYPEVRLDLVCTDRVVDLIREGFDVGVRAGPLSDSSMVARGLGGLRSYLVASPAYAKAHGLPAGVEELRSHEAVVFGAGADANRWVMRRGDEVTAIQAVPRLVVNDFDFMDAAVLAGLGIAMLPAFRCAGHLRDGRLVRVLPAFCSEDIPLHAVYPSTRHLSPKVGAFLDALREYMTHPPWERALE